MELAVQSKLRCACQHCRQPCIAQQRHGVTITNSKSTSSCCRPSRRSTRKPKTTQRPYTAGHWTSGWLLSHRGFELLRCSSMRWDIEPARLQLLSRMHVDHCKAELWSGRLQEGGKVYEVRPKQLMACPLASQPDCIPLPAGGSQVVERTLAAAQMSCSASCKRSICCAMPRCDASGCARCMGPASRRSASASSCSSTRGPSHSEWPSSRVSCARTSHAGACSASVRLSHGLWPRAGVPLPLEVALRWGIDVATALAELHREGILVLDVK